MGKENGRGVQRHRGNWNGRGRGYGKRYQYQRGPSGNKYQEANDTDGNNKKGRCSRDLVGERLAEKDVGITEFINKGSGFSGIIKERYSDFQVNEISLEGDIVKLTSCQVPSEASEIPESSDTITRHDLIPLDVWDELKALYDKTAQEKKLPKSQAGKAEEKPAVSLSTSTSEVDVDTKEDDLNSVELEVTDLDKGSRRAIHMCIKNAFPSLNSNTKDKEGKKYIVIRPGEGKRTDRRKGGKYLYFVVHKRNADTAETVNLISKNLRLGANSITYAGTKDRRGITSQLMCLRGGDPKRLFYVSKGLRGVSLGNYSFKDKALHLGDLRGNQFRIAIRKVSASDEEIEKTMSSLKEFGFINYFGLQRFGSNSAVPTHEIGKLLLQEKWEKAVEAILHPREESKIGSDDVSAACKEWHSNRDAKKALLKLKQGAGCIEGSLLKGLSTCQPTDFVGALSSVARNTRSLYLHSYQSFIWNRIVSRRIREYGLQPIVGDLILVETPLSSDPTESNPLSVEDPKGLDKEGDSPCVKQEVRCITAEDLPNISIEDVVLPMPGYGTVYPNNVLQNWYLELLKEDELTFDSFQPRVQQYSLKGAYRHLISRPTNLSWSTVFYKNSETDLILSDLDEMLGKHLCLDKEGSLYKALLITLHLNTSSYATMALRELLKNDTSASNQARLSSDTSNDIVKGSISQEKDKQVDKLPASISTDSTSNVSDSPSNLPKDTVINQSESELNKITDTSDSKHPCLSSDTSNEIVEGSVSQEKDKQVDELPERSSTDSTSNGNDSTSNLPEDTIVELSECESNNITEEGSKELKRKAENPSEECVQEKKPKSD